ncbi:peptide-N4-asparagine amidase [Kutzneria albida]|uniref:peptide-N4-asparagine amidase n=1 Tax=Kutzneria albida TaxID=43357 RepID=UPI00046CB661|nr:peptide-N4-asparagine amidase [Kutzneria albida]
MRRILAALVAAAAVVTTAPQAAAAPADRVVTDYQDPVQALPPVSRPPTPSCTVTAMKHTFANSYGQPYVGTLAPPAQCAGPWTKVVLSWTASSKGRQYDRLAGLWIGGAEVLRTSTPEPDPSGITWHFDRDITEFSPLLHRAQPFVMDLGNVVNQTYTGPYDVEVTVTYYQADRAHPAPEQADTVLPLAADAGQPGWQALPDGKNYTAQVTVPANTAKLTAQVYARGGGCEEFWWSNVPTELAKAYPQAGLCGGGTYREVGVRVDGRPAGVVAPYSVIYTGGVAPMLWRPISAIDAIVTLPYTIDLSPFLGTLTDGRPHTVELVPPHGIVDSWTLGGNLFATTDPGVRRVTGTAPSTELPEAEVRVGTTGTGLDTSIATHVARSWHTSALLHTSRGLVPVRASGQWTFDNTTKLADSASKQNTDQHVVGSYGSMGKVDGFDFSLRADVTQKIVDDNNYRIDASVHMGRRLWTVGGGRPALSEDTIDTSGGFGRTNGVLTYADGRSHEQWTGLDDVGRWYSKRINTEHGYVV